MLLTGAVIVLVLFAALAVLPIDRLPAWVNVYVGVAIASIILVVLTVLLT